jgi:hypothetical protein
MLSNPSPSALADSITITWSIDDVKSRGEATDFTNAQCREVLRRAKLNHDNMKQAYNSHHIYDGEYMESSRIAAETRARTRFTAQDVQSIPLGYAYDKWNRVLSFRGENNFWAVYTRDNEGRDLTFSNSVGDWSEIIRDGAGYLLEEFTGKLNRHMNRHSVAPHSIPAGQLDEDEGMGHPSLSPAG